MNERHNERKTESTDRQKDPIKLTPINSAEEIILEFELWKQKNNCTLEREDFESF